MRAGKILKGMKLTVCQFLISTQCRVSKARHWNEPVDPDQDATSQTAKKNALSQEVFSKGGN
jgi:hypothetical protein